MDSERRATLLRHAGDVVNQHTMTSSEKRKALYVGRGSPHGNPYKVEAYTRQGSIDEFIRDMQRMDPKERVRWLMPVARALRDGKKLRCYCVPALCHGMALAAWVRMHPEFAPMWNAHVEERM